MNMITRSYEDLIKLKSFDERFNYLFIGDKIGNETFGEYRYINQRFYLSPKWRKTRNDVIVRDLGCDLGVDGCELGKRNVIIHHINPITMEDIINLNPKVFDLNNLITCSFDTHNRIHYGGKKTSFVIRSSGDHCPWKIGGENN